MCQKLELIRMYVWFGFSGIFRLRMYIELNSFQVFGQVERARSKLEIESDGTRCNGWKANQSSTRYAGSYWVDAGHKLAICHVTYGKEVSFNQQRSSSD